MCEFWIYAERTCNKIKSLAVIVHPLSNKYPLERNGKNWRKCSSLPFYHCAYTINSLFSFVACYIMLVYAVHYAIISWLLFCCMSGTLESSMVKRRRAAYMHLCGRKIVGAVEEAGKLSYFLGFNLFTVYRHKA